MSDVTIKLGTIGTVKKHFLSLSSLKASRGWKEGTTGETVPTLNVDTGSFVYIGGTAYGDMGLSLELNMLIRNDMDPCRTEAVIRHEDEHVKDATRIYRSIDRKLKLDAAFTRLFKTKVTNTSNHKQAIETRAKDVYRKLTDAAAKTRDKHSTSYMKKSDKKCALKPGMKGSEVKLLKTLLNKATSSMMAPLPVNDKYDENTKKRVIMFKDSLVIPSRPGDSRAVVDRNTWKYLEFYK